MLIVARAANIYTMLTIYLGVSLYGATIILDEEHCQRGQYSFRRNINTGQSLIEFSGPNCTIARTYDQCTATTTAIKSTRTIDSKTMKEIIDMIQGMDNIESHNIKRSNDHKGRLVYNLIDECRCMVRECIEMLPRPIGYFLSFWPIRPVINSCFPKK